MSDVDAAPHATPDQVRAAEKRREAETTARTSKTAKRAAKKA